MMLTVKFVVGGPVYDHLHQAFHSLAFDRAVKIGVEEGKVLRTS
jgi:hypothetical protein